MRGFPHKNLPWHAQRQDLAVLAFVLLLLAAVTVMAGEQDKQPLSTTVHSPGQTSMPSAPTVIPVADVVSQATQVASLLRSITDKLAPGAQIDKIRKSLPEVAVQVEGDMEKTMGLLQRQPTLSVLQAQQQHWQGMRRMYTGWLATLTKRSQELQEKLKLLDNLQKSWAATLTNARNSEAPVTSLRQIKETIANILALRTPLKEQFAQLLDLQSRVGNEVTRCETVLAKIAQLQEVSLSDTLVQDSLPVWNATLWADVQSTLSQQVRSAASSYGKDISSYITASSKYMVFFSGIFAVLALFFLAARNQLLKWTAAGEAFSPAIRIFEHPLAAALTLALLFVTSPYWLPLPATLRNTLQFLALAPMIILIRPFASRRLLSALYALIPLFAIDTIREIFSTGQLQGQIFLTLESLAGLAVMIWFLRKLRPGLGESAESFHLRVLQAGAVFALLLLASGFAGAAMGYVLLARLITPGLIDSAVLALTLYASLHVLVGLIAVAFHIWPLRTLRMIQNHHYLLEKRLFRFLVWTAFVAFLVRYLGYLGLLEPFQTLGRTTLNAKWERGDFSISLGNILEFILMVWAAYLLSAFLRFILREDVYPRVSIAQGKSYAVSSLLHYFILALGFTAAIAALGVNLTKLTVLTGAFGVGIGFGLQSVVNNFVSGLILLFERPIQVGDTVEFGDLLCRVRRIGIRASIVHTRSGADIIVPNSQFIAEKVTNWTHSDQLRRIELPVGISYGTPPQSVLTLLVSVALRNPHILQDPAPKGLVTGFGDSAINYELRAWTDRFDDWRRIKSELASTVYDEVLAAGMTFPFPQREVRILKDAEAGDVKAADLEREMISTQSVK